MAERQGFEPWLEFPLNTLSKRAPSATRPSLRCLKARLKASLAISVYRMRKRESRIFRYDSGFAGGWAAQLMMAGWRSAGGRDWASAASCHTFRKCNPGRDGSFDERALSAAAHLVHSSTRPVAGTAASITRTSIGYSIQSSFTFN